MAPAWRGGSVPWVSRFLTFHRTGESIAFSDDVEGGGESARGERRRPMVRALVTAAVMVFGVATVGVAALVVGLVHPWRRVFAWAALVWGRSILFCAGVRLTVEGAERVADGVPRFFMANHQSALDIPILFAALKGDVRFMAKEMLFRIPIFGWTIRRYGFVPIHRSRARATLGRLDVMLERLERNPVSFAVFPEGTRSRDGKLQPFRRGTIKIGQRCGLPLVPVTIEGAIDVLHRDRFRVRPGPVRVVFGEPIPAKEASAMSPAALQDRIVGTIAVELGQTRRDAAADGPVCASTEGT